MIHNMTTIIVPLLCVPARFSGQKRIMRVQHGGTVCLLGLFNVLLNAFILSFIT